MTMKAIVYRRYGGPEVLDYVDVEKPVAGEGKVLVRVRASSVNAADYRMMRADPFLARLANGLLAPKRQILGVDVAGVVEAVGPGVQRFAVGDEVLGDAFQDGMGAFAEYVAMREDALVHKPREIRFETAAAVPLAGIAALQAVRDKGGVRAGTTVLIQGAGGGVGTFLVQIAKALGGHVTAVCGPNSLALVRRLGADQVVDYTQERFPERGERYDVIVGVNGYHTLGEYARCLNPGGTYVMVGGTNAQIFDALLFAPIRFLATGKHAGALTIDYSRQRADLLQLAEWLASGTLEPVIDREFELRETAEAIRYVERGHVRGKVVLRV